MALKSKPFVRISCLAFVIVTLCTLSFFFRGEASNKNGLLSSGNQPSSPAKDTFESLSLTAAQCENAFPDLTKDIDEAVARGPFKYEKTPGDYKGLVQGRIKNGKLYIISAAQDTAEEVLWERNAVLHQLHRAILTSPSPLPDTIFSFCVNDQPKNNSWSFARPTKRSSTLNNWLMPHFSFWSWPLPFIGTFDEALSKIANVERSTPWEQKIDKAVWRGTVWFNPIGNLNLRPELLRIAGGQEWADVKNLKWESGGKKAENAIGIEDFCRYKYIIYTEGVTYSGRLHYHQACASIILTPPFNYIQHTGHLIRPVSSSSLLSSTNARPSVESDGGLASSSSYIPADANIVFVAPDWSDLKATITYLRAQPEIAKSIAQRQRQLMVGKGYLSPAAEVCYWRALISGWSTVTMIDKTHEELSSGSGAMRWESFNLRGQLEWG
ncbi:hypothetical protein AOQ84DRAFT_306094 [Glonium stellatum]|uniref:Glycosyl transferase CAP10 domain-containing protein n=1 Tax=Glonium stellatum TaxID=574774 RepID=A0A8E2EN60_9PEZI|nr:hypothetical protein AOQ84DRAFT_306094 [Glonium stellatum]